MTRRCGLMLRERGVPVTVINRTLDTAQELAAELGGTRAVAARRSARIRSPRAARCWCVPAGPARPVIDRDVLVKLATARPLLIDFGLPPNVDVDAARVLDFTRVGMDDLVQTARDGRVEHLLRLAPVRTAIDSHLARLRSELAARAIGPQLAQLRDDFERITAGEVDRLLREVLQDLDPRAARPAEPAGVARWRIAWRTCPSRACARPPSTQVPKPPKPFSAKRA